MRTPANPFRRTALAPGAAGALCLALALFALPALPALAQGGDMEDVTIEAIPVAEGLWMLTGQGGNIGVSAGEDGVFLVDDQYAPLTEKIRAAVAELSDQPIRFVLNTHWHGDHTGGNENLGKAGALIVAHENVRERMSADQFLSAFRQVATAKSGAALPVVTFDSSVTFHINGDTIRAHHGGPAHTDGDSVIYFEKANAVHMGDTYFNGMYPFIDVSTGGTVDGMIENARRVLAEIDDQTKVIPGHGALSNKAELTAFVEMLEGVRGAVRPLVARGKTLAEIQEMDPLAPWNETWGGGFMGPEQFLAVVWTSLRSGG